MKCEQNVSCLIIMKCGWNECFSRFARDKKEGKLLEPVESNTSHQHEIDCAYENESEVTLDISLRQYKSMELLKSDFDLNINDYVYVCFSAGNKRKHSRLEHFAGIVTNVMDDNVTLNLLDAKDNYFSWPNRVKTWCIEITEVHLKLSTPSIDRRLHVIFDNDDLEDMINCCKI